MPVIRYEDLKQFKEQDRDPFATISSLGRFSQKMFAIANQLEKQGDKELAEAVRGYRSAAMDAHGLDVNEDEPTFQVSQALKTLDQFRSFLYRKDEKGVTNFQKLRDAYGEVTSGSEADKATFDDSLAYVNSLFGLGVNMTLLHNNLAAPKKEAEEEANEEPPAEEAPAEEEQNEPGIRPVAPSADIEGPSTAALQIERLRRIGIPEKNVRRMSEYQKVNAILTIAKIMAAREMAQSVRGDRTKLDEKFLTSQDIQDRHAAFMQDPTFNAFIETLRQDPRKFQAAVNAAKDGHGGGLDDQFRQYLKKLPAGQMPTSPFLKRYLPTYKERIEFLKGQAKARIDRGETAAAEMAEIVALRGMARAIRGKKSSLNKPVDVVVNYTLGDRVRDLSHDDVFLAASQTTAVKDLVTEGHGGLMSETIRRQCVQNRLYIGNDASRILFGNTCSGRMERIKGQAESMVYEMRDAIRDHGANSAQVAEHMEASKKMLAEYMMLDSTMRDPQTHDLSSGWIKDAPWGDIRDFSERPQDYRAMHQFVDSFTPQEMQTAMEKIAFSPQNEVMLHMVAQRRIFNERANRQQAQQPQPQQANGPQGLQPGR